MYGQIAVALIVRHDDDHVRALFRPAETGEKRQ